MASQNPGDGALLLLPSRRVQARVIPWRRLYDPEHWRTIPPHITLAYPFVRQEEWTALRPALAGCLAAFRPFWVTMARLGSFEAPQAVLWFRPDDGGTITRIYSTLSQCLAPCAQSYMQPGPLPFVPHLTVGFFDSSEELDAAKARVEAAWQPLRFRARALQYAVHCADCVWRMVDELPLGGSGGER